MTDFWPSRDEFVADESAAAAVSHDLCAGECWGKAAAGTVMDSNILSLPSIPGNVVIEGQQK